jgi:hypothetical protein
MCGIVVPETPAPRPQERHWSSLMTDEQQAGANPYAVSPAFMASGPAAVEPAQGLLCG